MRPQGRCPSRGSGVCPLLAKHRQVSGPDITDNRHFTDHCRAYGLCLMPSRAPVDVKIIIIVTDNCPAPLAFPPLFPFRSTNQTGTISHRRRFGSPCFYHVILDVPSVLLHQILCSPTCILVQSTALYGGHRAQSCGRGIGTLSRRKSTKSSLDVMFRATDHPPPIAQPP